MSQAHEQWFHFTKEPRYFAAVDEVREPHLFPNQTRTPSGRGQILTRWAAEDCAVNNPLGKLPGSVWNLTYWECVDRIERGWAPKDNPVILLNPPEDECPPLARTPWLAKP